MSTKPAKPHYAFNLTDEEGEKGRLRRIEALFDGHSTCMLSRGLPAEHLLEVGPGAGSLLHWAKEKGIRVSALDINPRFIHEFEFPGVRVHTGDMSTYDFGDETFDLIHARFVFMHVAKPEDALLNLKKALRPGGHVVLEDGDFQISRSLAGPEHLRQAADKVFEATRKGHKFMGKSSETGSVLPILGKACGFTVKDFSSWNMIGPGGGNLAAMMAESVSAVAESLLRAGIVSEDDLTHYQTFTEDPDCWALYYGYGQVLLEKAD